MCGRFTNWLTWGEIVALYRLTVPAIPERNLPARYNICPTQTIDAVIEHEGKRELIPMRWGLIPSWWKKGGERHTVYVQCTGGDGGNEADVSLRFQAHKVSHPGFGLLRVAQDANGQAALLLHSAGWLSAHNRRATSK